MKLKFIDEVNIDTNKNILKKPRMLCLGLFLHRISLWIAACCNYVEWCKTMKQPDCFELKGKVALHQEQEQKGPLYG